MNCSITNDKRECKCEKIEHWKLARSIQQCNVCWQELRYRSAYIAIYICKTYIMRVRIFTWIFFFVCANDEIIVKMICAHRLVHIMSTLQSLSVLRVGLCMCECVCVYCIYLDIVCMLNGCNSCANSSHVVCIGRHSLFNCNFVALYPTIYSNSH